LNYLLDNDIREEFMFTLLIWSEHLQMLCRLLKLFVVGDGQMNKCGALTE